MTILYNNIGKDLSRVSMPAALNEPLSLLQRLSEELEYSALLDTANSTDDPYQRMVRSLAANSTDDPYQGMVPSLAANSTDDAYQRMVRSVA